MCKSIKHQVKHINLQRRSIHALLRDIPLEFPEGAQDLESCMVIIRSYRPVQVGWKGYRICLNLEVIGVCLSHLEGSTYNL